ncbi:MAG: hypothetical protein LUD15_12535 [Bacteroides sp.]|nr:hypothetical protein [Bacteroides sp.]
MSNNQPGNNGITTRGKDCYDSCYYFYDEECEDDSYWEEDEYGTWLIIIRNCYEVVTDEWCTEQCYFYPDPEDPNDWNSGWEYPNLSGSVDPPSEPGTGGNPKPTPNPEPIDKSKMLTETVYELSKIGIDLPSVSFILENESYTACIRVVDDYSAAEVYTDFLNMI